MQERVLASNLYCLVSSEDIFNFLIMKSHENH